MREIRCEISQWRRSGVFIVNVEHIFVNFEYVTAVQRSLPPSTNFQGNQKIQKYKRE